MRSTNSVPAGTVTPPTLSDVEAKSKPNASALLPGSGMRGKDLGAAGRVFADGCCRSSRTERDCPSPDQTRRQRVSAPWRNCARLARRATLRLRPPVSVEATRVGADVLDGRKVRARTVEHNRGGVGGEPRKVGEAQRSAVVDLPGAACERRPLCLRHGSLNQQSAGVDFDRADCCRSYRCRCWPCRCRWTSTVCRSCATTSRGRAMRPVGSCRFPGVHRTPPARLVRFPRVVPVPPSS